MIEQETHDIVPIAIERLLQEVDALRSEGWRIVQVLCISDAEGHELSYTFGLGMRMKSLRFRAAAAVPVPSITAVFPAAFLYENEVRDLFGVLIERIAGDWDGKVYDVEEGPSGAKPFSKVSVQAISSEAAAR